MKWSTFLLYALINKPTDFRWVQLTKTLNDWSANPWCWLRWLSFLILLLILLLGFWFSWKEALPRMYQELLDGIRDSGGGGFKLLVTTINTELTQQNYVFVNLDTFFIVFLSKFRVDKTNFRVDTLIKSWFLIFKKH